MILAKNKNSGKQVHNREKDFFRYHPLSPDYKVKENADIVILNITGGGREKAESKDILSDLLSLKNIHKFLYLFIISLIMKVTALRIKSI